MGGASMMGRSRPSISRSTAQSVKRFCCSQKLLPFLLLVVVLIIGVEFVLLERQTQNEDPVPRIAVLDNGRNTEQETLKRVFQTVKTQGNKNNSARPNHLGCWLQTERQGRFPGTSMINPSMTVHNCLEYCSIHKFTYAGIKNGVECWCNSTIGDYVPSHACNEPCPGDRTFLCGGKTSMNVYAVNETHRRYGYQEKPRKVLILAYMRTGSTFTSEFYNQYPDSFFIFEPFFRLGYPHPSIIQHLLTCQFERVPSDILYRQWGYWHGHMQKSFIHFFKCMYKVGVGGFHRCLALLKLVCERATLRVVKEIEITMSDALLLKEVLPELKIVHLVRDPRAVTFSRIHVGERNTPKHAQKYCYDVAADLISVSKVPPRDLFSLRYENISEHPLEMASELYKFIDLPLTVEVIDWIKRATGMKNWCGGKKICKMAYSTFRSNSTKTAYKWKETIPFKVVKYVDARCTEMYSKLGYLPIPREEDLRNPKLRHRNWL